MSGSLADFVASLLSIKQTKTELEKLIEGSQRLLGDKAQIPKPSFDPGKVNADLTRTCKELEASFERLRKVVLERENDGATALNDLESYRGQIAKSDFGLNAKDKADAKKIKEAHDIFDAYFKPKIAFWSKTNPSLKKKIDDMGKFHFK